MHTFTVDDAAALDGPDWLRRQRIAAMERFLAGPLPTSADEIWRYSRIDEFDLGAYNPTGRQSLPTTTPARVPAAQAVGRHAALVETLDGRLLSVELSDAARAAGVSAAVAGQDDEGVVGRTSDDITPWDAYAELNRALAVDPVVIRVPPGAVVEAPIVVTHRVVSAGIVLPRTVVEVGQGARATVVECLASDDVAAYVSSVVELDLADAAHLSHVIVQELGQRVWATALHTSRVGRDASLRSFTVALGGDYARVRTDSRLVGAGGSTELLALYFGEGTQMHDFRTLQDHEGPKSTSELLFKGAVVDEARSAYSGLIRVRRGAAGTKAFQTNRNLVLSDTGLATYSVPNLDIEENDVSCSHASATGPIDADQLFYLESRGVPTDVAQRLIVLGFFDDILERLPVDGLRIHLFDAVAGKLHRASIEAAS